MTDKLVHRGALILNIIVKKLITMINMSTDPAGKLVAAQIERFEFIKAFDFHIEIKL